jgi:hypothetical protein
MRGNGVDDPEEEQIFRDLWEDETQREVVMESLKPDCDVRVGRPPGSWGSQKREGGLVRGLLFRRPSLMRGPPVYGPLESGTSLLNSNLIHETL